MVLGLMFGIDIASLGDGDLAPVQDCLLIVHGLFMSILLGLIAFHPKIGDFLKSGTRTFLYSSVELFAIY